MLEQKLVKTFQEYLKSIGKQYNEDSNLIELTEIIRKCNSSAPDEVIGRLFRNTINR